MVEDPYDIENYEEVLEERISAFSNNCMVLFESLSTIIDMCGEKETLKKIAAWNEVFQERKITSIYNFVAWPYAGTILNKLRRLFDAIIDVCSISERVIIGQCYCPTKIKWGGKTGDSVPFRVCKPGGVKNYTPKICVIGPHNAGKSSFIESLSMKSLSTKKIESNITVEHGFIKHVGFTVDILGIQGDQDIKSFIETINKDLIGVFLVIDSTNPSKFIWAKKVLDAIRLAGLPLIIVANKQDAENAVTKGGIEKKLKITPDIPVIPTVATEGKNVISAYEKLIEIITKRNIYGKQ
jgi:small GTP-binding protein